MNWDKQSIIAVVLGAAALIWWYAFGAEMFEKPSSPAPTPVPAAAEKAAVPAAAPTAVRSKTAQAELLKSMPEVVISGAETSYAIQPVTGAVKKISFDKKLQKNAKGETLELLNENSQNNWLGAFGISSPAGGLKTLKVVQSKKLNDKEYLLTRMMRDQAGRDFTVVTTYKALDNYQIQMKMLVSNPGSKAIQLGSLQVSAGEMPQWYRLSGDPKSNSQELHTVEYCNLKGKVKNEDAVADDDDWQELNGKNVRWLGAVNRFYAQLLSCSEPVKLAVDRKSLNGNKEYVVNTNAVIDGFTLAPATGKEFTFNYYFGPKEPTALRKFDPEATEVMHLGWFPIDFLAYIMLAIMNWLYGLIGSFGWSIILLTLLIRTIFFPVTMKANASMREMSALSPKLKEIREKYKDEPMVAQAKMSELYKEHKVNPMGGCLPMLIQIPVFIALYYALGSAAELRQQSFWWINDLAQPDTVCHIFGLAINPLIIAWTLLMVVQQKLTPTTMDPTQAKVMLMMPLVMLFILYTLPAALTLYWTVSQIFSIAQMMYQNKLKKAEDAKRNTQDNKSDKPKIVRS